jgi:light-regulated signal transduction histidine kinase (bacteriophytochrome)
MNGFSQILLDEHAQSLSDQARHYMEMVRTNAQQMGNLVDDLLTFSRLNRQPLNRQPVDLADLVRHVIWDLNRAQEGRQVDIVIGDLPACRADPVLLKQVFTNLLSNALKYTRRRDAARIEIGSLDDGQQPGRTVYFVKDNGVGFDMQYADKLFGVFQRLHLAEDFEGTGVGLAIVQRIIHRHGGRIWAEATVNQGATFFFTLEGGSSDE